MNANARELAASFDLEKLTGEFYADPYPTYHALREHEPVKRLPNGSYFLTRYDDLVSAYKNTKLFSSDKKKEFFPKYGNSLLYEHHTTSLVFNDPPAHARVPRLILGARRRAKPGNPERAVLTRLIQGEDNGERLSSKELLHNCIFLLNAGHETTTNLIGNGLVALSANSAQKKRLIEHPDLIKTAIEEILRFESSNQLGNRMTTERVELGGVTLGPCTPVRLCIGAANRDPRQFTDPETLDIGRTPNRHLPFAPGAHQCAGMALARFEGAIAISRFLARFPNYALNGPPVRGGRVRFRGFLSVPCLAG